MLRKFLLILFFVSLSPLPIFAENEAKDGVLDLRNWNPKIDGTLQLYGEWEFFWKQLVTPTSSKEMTSKHRINVPALWNDKEIDGETLSGSGYSTLRLKLIFPEKKKVYAIRVGDMYSAYNLWIDGELIAQNGIVGTEKNNTRAQWLPVTKVFFIDKQEVEILLQIANFHHRKGGTWSDLLIGEPDQIFGIRTKALVFDLFLFGSLLIMAIYHVGLYLLRKNEKSTIYFAFFCIAAILRILVTGERYLVYIFPDIPFELQLKLEYLSFFISLPLFVFFLYLALPGYIHKKVLNLSIFVMGLFSLIVLFTNGTIYSHTAIPAQIIVFIYLFYTIAKLFHAIQEKSKGGIAALFGISALIITFIIDILYNNEIINFGNIAPLGVFIFIFSQSFLLSQKFSNAFDRIEILSDDIQRTNKVYSYFVPTEFLELLKIENIVDIKLGDLAEREMTILFSDIRDFTRLSESMTPRENFEFINSYLRIVAPYIVMNRGFIDKYIGDGIMAIFPEQVLDAIDAGLQMLEALSKINESRGRAGREEISIGIGIHTGSTIIGTVGAMERMQGTVISDVVNLASRLEGLTKVFGAQILISEAIFKLIPSTSPYSYRYLGEIEVKGKSHNTKVWEILAGKDERTIKKQEQKAELEGAIQLFEKGDLAQARQKFLSVKEKNPSDKAIDFYLNKLGQSPSDN